MKISTKGRYGLCFMLDLALHAGRGAVSLRDAALREGISEKYLWQVAAPLRAAGLIQTLRGSRGGFALARRPEQITLADVLGVLEHTDGLLDMGQPPKARDRVIGQVAYGACVEIGEHFIAAMRAVSVADLVERYRRRQQDAALDYEI